MSRTKRNLKIDIDVFKRCLRKPKTFNEISKLNNLLLENKIEDLKLSKINRIRKRLNKIPVYWDDLLISAFRELRK